MKESCDTLREAFLELKEEYSIEIFDDAERTYGLMMDLLATQEKELTKFERFNEVGGLRAMLDALSESLEEQGATIKIIFRLTKTKTQNKLSVKQTYLIIFL